MSKKGKIARAVAITVSAILVLMLAAIMVISGMVYESIFGGRFDLHEWDSTITAKYPGLQIELCQFTSDKGQKLAAAKYSKGLETTKGVIVLAHGYGGGGHFNYMDYVDWFTSHEYLVFAYDATGNDNSEGKGVGGLPQGVIDLDHALDFVEQQPEYAELPIMLFGHSWGGYSVGNVLNVHPEVNAVVVNAGFNSSADMIKQEGEKYVGKYADIFIPFVTLYERLKYGKYAGYSALKGFGNTDAGVMILHGGLDGTVLAENGYDLFFEKYGDSDRFEFLWFKLGGHEDLCYQGRRLNDEVMTQILQFYNSYAEK